MGAHLTLLGISTAGIAIAGLFGEWILDANNLSKLGLTAFMAFCLIVMGFAIMMLCRFIVKVMLPLKDAIEKLSGSVKVNTGVMVEVKDEMIRSGRK